MTTIDEQREVSAAPSPHSPTPWHLSGQGSVKYGRDGCVCRVNWNNRKANAAFIIRAVNSHDALVKALDRAIPLLEVQHSLLTSDARRYAFGILRECRAALATAKGEA